MAVKKSNLLVMSLICQNIEVFEIMLDIIDFGLFIFIFHFQPGITIKFIWVVHTGFLSIYLYRNFHVFKQNDGFFLISHVILLT